MARWKRIPSIFRWFLVTMAIIIIVGLGAYAYRVLTIEGEVTVLEAIEVDPETFEVSMFPGEVIEQPINIHNKSSAELKVDLLEGIDPDDQGVSLRLSKNSLKIPGNGTEIINVIIMAGNDAVPGIYTISVPVDRNKLEDEAGD